MNITETTIVRAGADQMSCDLEGEAAILHLSSGVYFGLDEVGAEIWRLLENEIEVREIERRLISEYDVEPDACSSDVRRLLGEMLDAGIVEIAQPAGGD